MLAASLFRSCRSLRAWRPCIFSRMTACDEDHEAISATSTAAAGWPLLLDYQARCLIRAYCCSQLRFRATLLRPVLDTFDWDLSFPLRLMALSALRGVGSPSQEVYGTTFAHCRVSFSRKRLRWQRHRMEDQHPVSAFAVWV